MSFGADSQLYGCLTNPSLVGFFNQASTWVAHVWECASPARKYWPHIFIYVKRDCTDLSWSVASNISQQQIAQPDHSASIVMEMGW